LFITFSFFFFLYKFSSKKNQNNFFAEEFVTSYFFIVNLEGIEQVIELEACCRLDINIDWHKLVVFMSKLKWEWISVKEYVHHKWSCVRVCILFLIKILISSSSIFVFKVYLFFEILNCAFIFNEELQTKWFVLSLVQNHPFKFSDFHIKRNMLFEMYIFKTFWMRMNDKIYFSSIFDFVIFIASVWLQENVLNKQIRNFLCVRMVLTLFQLAFTSHVEESDDPLDIFKSIITIKKSLGPVWTFKRICRWIFSEWEQVTNSIKHSLIKLVSFSIRCINTVNWVFLFNIVVNGLSIFIQLIKGVLFISKLTFTLKLIIIGASVFHYFLALKLNVPNLNTKMFCKNKCKIL